ncbi:hypothetical protein N431DRAFT_434387 [Stipitochalara longipes BDJ]|nr:hypothetical protein N431DRAFT_434387 [Stipitochalara longipes BDJ]
MPLTKDPNIPPQPGSRQGALIGLQIFFIVVALFVYGLRVYTRRVILRSLGNDDYIMGVAVLLSIALTVNACISTTHGWATHLSSIPSSNIHSLLLSIYLSELLFTLSTSFAKLSILFFYLRLAVTRTYRRVIYASIVLIAVWAVVFSCVVILQCHPVSAYWDPDSTTCYSPEAALFIHGLTNTVTDVYIYILPMHMVWNVQLPKRQRVGLLIIFAAGFLVCVAGALRLYYSIITDKSPDTPWEGFYLWTWESIEVNLGIVCASAPCLKSMISRIVPRFFSSQNSSSDFASLEMASRLRDKRERTGMGGVGGIDKGRGFVMTTVTAGRSGRKVGGGGESQDDLTDGWVNGHERVLIAKADVHDMA